jgi:hypothetical protein
MSTVHMPSITFHQYTIEDEGGPVKGVGRIYHVLPPESSSSPPPADSAKVQPLARHTAEAHMRAAGDDANSGPAAAQLELPLLAAPPGEGQPPAAATADDDDSSGGGRVDDPNVFRGLQRFRPRDSSSSAALELQQVGWVRFEDAQGVSQGAIVQGRYGVKITRCGLRGAPLCRLKTTTGKTEIKEMTRTEKHDSSSGDFAEWHRRAPNEKPYEEGDVVGIWPDGLRRQTVRL